MEVKLAGNGLCRKIQALCGAGEQKASFNCVIVNCLPE